MQWKGKTIYFLGDSITAGGCATEGNDYITVVENSVGCVAKRYGVGGTRIAKQTKELSQEYAEYFLKRAERMIKECSCEPKDFIFVFGGTNDYGHGDAPMGKSTDFGENTFCGAVNQLIDYLVAKFTSKKICFILPLPAFALLWF